MSKLNEKSVSGHFYEIPKKYLILAAGIVWFAAGFNILRIGIMATGRPWTVLGVLAAGAVFAVFFGLIFRRLISKHTRRISDYQEKRVNILCFFDMKSYAIMIFMMTFGILLRRANVWPNHCIRMFYTGIGSSLLAAGIGFIFKFISFNKQEFMRQKELESCPKWI